MVFPVVIVLFLFLFSQLVSSLQTRSENVPIFCGCERIFGRESTDVIWWAQLFSSPFMLDSFPLIFLSFCIHFLSCCIHFLSCWFFILLSCPLMFRSGGYPPKRSHFCHISLSFLLSFNYRFGGLCRLPSQASWTCTYISSLSFFPSYRFLCQQRIGSIKVQAKLKCDARGYYTIPFGHDFPDQYSQWGRTAVPLHCLVSALHRLSGWWLRHPSDKYESQLGWWHSQLNGKVKKVPNHQRSFYSLVLRRNYT